MTVVLTPGQAHEALVFPQLLAQGAVRRPGRGRPRVRPIGIKLTIVKWRPPSARSG